MAAWIWVNIGSGNGLLPDSTKPLPEPMISNFTKSAHKLNVFGDYTFKIISSPSGELDKLMHSW